MTASVTAEQRHTRQHRCPICDGADGDPRGQGKRCDGWTTSDQEWVHCARPELAGSIEPDQNGRTYGHRMHGSCRCGTTHGPAKETTRAEKVYDYRDESGVLLFQVVRKSGPEKRFLQRVPDGAGGWIWKLAGVRRVLYQLPRLIAANPGEVVYIVEGEKDVDTLAARGILATCNPQGAGKWHYVADHARDVLRDRVVVVVADTDEVGRPHARDVEKSLRDVVRSVQVLEAPAPHKDVTDLISAGGSLADLIVPPIEEPISTADASGSPGPIATDPLRGLPLLSKIAVVGRARFIELAEAPVHYVWSNIAVAGEVVLMASGPGEGKTTLLFLILAARAHEGEPRSLLGHRLEPAPPGKWLVVIEGEHAEGSASRKLRKSMRLLGVKDDAFDRFILLARKAVKLGSPEWAEVVKLCAAGIVSDIAIDTIARVAPGNADNEAEQVAIFDQVATAIEAAPDTQPKPIVWAVGHTRKSGTGEELADVSGSTQRVGQADTVLMLKGDKVDGRTVATRVTFAKIREEPEVYPLPVTFSISSDRIILAEVDDDDSRPLEARVLEQIQTGPKTKNALATTLRRSGADIEGAITNLFESKAITTTFVSVRGRHCKAFTVRNLTRLDTRLDLSEGDPT